MTVAIPPPRVDAMRIVLVAPEFPPSTGGMEVHAGETALGLTARGHSILVLTVPGLAPRPPRPDLPVREVLTREHDAALARIRAATRRFGGDVMLVMNAGFSTLALAPTRKRPPIVVRTAGNDAYGAWYGPRLPLRFLFWRLPHAHPRSLGARLRRLDQERRVGAVLAGLARCDRVLCNSSYTLARLRSLGVPAALLRPVPGGVDPAVFRPSGAEGAPRPPGHPVVLGLAARLKPIKGVDVALKMLRSLVDRGVDGSLRVAGSGPEKGRLSALASELGVDRRVEFLGNLPADAMPDFYRGLDLYLQPSVPVRHQASGAIQEESMGRGILEAQACGKPVVASRTGGIPDVVTDGLTGRLVNPGDAEELACVVFEILQEPGARRRMGQAGRRRVLDHFSWEAVVRETERHLAEAHETRSG